MNARKLLLILTAVISCLMAERGLAADKSGPPDAKPAAGKAEFTGVAGQAKPDFGLVLLLEVDETNYDNFSEKLPEVSVSLNPTFFSPESYGVSARDWERLDENLGMGVILDGTFYPHKSLFDDHTMIYANPNRKYRGFKDLNFRHPLIMVIWRTSAEGYGRTGDYYKSAWLFPINTIPFELNTMHGEILASDYESYFRSYRYPPMLSISQFTPYGMVSVDDGITGKGSRLMPGEEWTLTREMKYPDGKLQPPDKPGDKMIYEKYVKGKEVDFKTIFKIKNRGYYYFKWPSGNK